jgi:hypothetical protein
MTARPASSEFQASDAVASPLALQARIALVREDILDAIGMMQMALDAAQAMAAIPSDSGLLHGLRLAKAHWRVISANAADLTAAHAELASALRQSEDTP